MNRKDRKTGPGSRPKGKVRGRNIMIRDDAVDKGTMGNRGSERAGDQEGQVEGRNPVLELLRSGRTVEKLLIARGAREGSILEIVQKAKAQGIVVQEVDRRRLNELSMTDGAHQGVIAFVTPYSYVEVEDILELASKRGEEPFLIVLDEITDPYNLGSVIRTAECCGAHGVIIPKRRAAGLTPAAIKASAGAVEFVPVAKVTNISDTLDLLKRHGLWVAGADMDGETYTSKDLTGPIALVVGSEGRGLGRLVREKCDFLVRIPLMGRISSLNASVAAGVLMYEVNRQRSK
jgi:23S rRNA (guanosine2251-2'-O)-methyltransferase